MVEGLESERKGLGLAVRTNDPASNISGDEQLFKFALITPKEPLGTASFEYKDGEGNTQTERRNIPQLVATMALGNLNAKEVALARIFSEMSRICSFHGYFDLAINYYLKVVHLNVTSQSHQSQLLRQILTETVSVSRKEESLAGTRDFTGERGSKVSEFIDKWKNKDAQGQSGQGQTNNNQNFGLR